MVIGMKLQKLKWTECQVFSHCCPYGKCGTNLSDVTAFWAVNSKMTKRNRADMRGLLTSTKESNPLQNRHIWVLINTPTISRDFWTNLWDGTFFAFRLHLQRSFGLIVLTSLKALGRKLFFFFNSLLNPKILPSSIIALFYNYLSSFEFQTFLTGRVAYAQAWYVWLAERRTPDKASKASPDTIT